MPRRKRWVSSNMSEYKCISCGEIKESKEACSCPVCGYKMFALPYDREEVLKKEIREFVGRLIMKELPKDGLDIFRKVPKKARQDLDEPEFDIIYKDQDDARFPGFRKIQDYVCASSKTEMFCERLNESIEQIRKHIHEPYEQAYQVSCENIKAVLTDLDETLKEALAVLDLDINIPEWNMPEITLDYSEIPDEQLIPAADGLLDTLLALSDKVRKFIKQNNIYGTAYQKRPKSKYKPSEEKDHLGDLTRYKEAVDKVLAKKYVVDIFSDGSEELSEMLTVLWDALRVIMTIPILAKTSRYTFSDGLSFVNDEFNRELLVSIAVRYAEVNDTLYAYDFLNDCSEEKLFSFYNKMIDLDTFGFMGVNKESLLKIGESEKKLNELIGLAEIKESIKKIKAYALANKDSDDLNIHMCFLGNPGSGKTEVARYIAGILYENKILPTKKIIEVDRSGLVSQYFGATAEKTSWVISQAMGGVLFIDEAYALANNSEQGITDYGKEAIDTLVKAMEDYRGKFCVILAGYRNEMQQMLMANPGFKSRIQFTLDFPNYSRPELKDIAAQMLDKRHYTIGDTAMSRILDITDIKRKEPNFANAREIRNILDQVIMCQNLRCAGTGDHEVGLVDVNKYIQDAKINLPTSGSGASKKLLTGEEELDQLVGLSVVKRMVKKIKAYAKRNKDDADFNMHMCFYGNPGTGKTEVARILSRILYDAGVLGEAKLVETNAQGILGKYVGETGPKTLEKIKEAMDGVLFLDEAYSLANSNASEGASASYGDEAIAVLLKEMEDHRGQFCVILAGYKDEMKTMIGSNPGLQSRIQFTLEFPDYTREELGEIAEGFLTKKNYRIDEAALNCVLDITEYYRNRPNFANARTVRNILDQVIMNQNLRTEDSGNDDLIILSDVEDYLFDEGIDLSKTKEEPRRIGFR